MIKTKRTTIAIIFALLILPALFASAPSASADQSKYQVSNDEIVSAFDNFLSNHDVYSNIPHRIYSKRIMDSVYSNSEIEIRIVDRKRSNILKGDNFQIVLMSSGKAIRRFEMRGYIGIEVPVAVAIRNINRGESLSSSDAYEFSWRDLSACPVRMPVYKDDDIGNLVMKVNCIAGRELDKNLMEQPDIIVRNERVIVFFEYNGLQLTMIGKAQESGKLGERIKILNEKSKKTIICKVTGHGEVEL